MKDIKIGTTLEKEFIVTQEQLASQVGSGIVDVYATPMMIAAMEQSACECLLPFLEEGETSVGVMIHTTHDAATPQGMKVMVSVEICDVDRKKVSFRIVAQDEKDTIGIASHDRVIVKKESFEARTKAKLD